VGSSLAKNQNRGFIFGLLLFLHGIGEA